MVLQYLLRDLENYEIDGDNNVEINKIEYDSKKIEKNDIFVAIKGFEADGNDFIVDAIKNGAVCVIVEKNVSISNVENVTIVKVENTRIALAKMAASYYDYPAKKINMIGITGTKGKTTTAYMIRDILNAAGKKTGMIGTVYNTYGNVMIESSRTSPESLDLQKILKDMVDSGMKYCVMEVSSHALELHRVYGIHFIIGVFTNLSEEHLDFHGNMDNYLKAKAKLFENCDFALVNSDDIYTPRLLKMINCKVAKYGLDNDANLTSSDVRVNPSYVEFKMYINKMLQSIVVNIPGRFTVYNALAAIGVSSLLNVQMDAILLALANVKVPGRCEVIDVKKTFTVMVDYAHNPSSLEAILTAMKKSSKGRVIVVFGCGGNRDTLKRSVMGQIAGRLADFTVITTDNPRNEDPKVICSQIEEGIKKTNGLYKIIENRKQAIAFAMRIAWKNDLVIIAGKGHETYQELKNGKKIKFDEREVVREIAASMPDKNIE